MRALWITAGIVFGLDQISKAIVVQGLNLASVGEIDVLPPLLNLRMAWNRGVNFGLLADDSDLTRWILIGVALAITAWVLVWMWRERPGRRARISAGLLVGGALGNVVDRLVYGAVADFLNVSCCGYENPYAFNVADIAIFAGALGLVLFTGGDRRPGDGVARKNRRRGGQEIGPRTGGPKTGGPRTGSPRTGDPRTGGSKTVGPKTGGPKTGGPRTVGQKTVGRTPAGRTTIGRATGGQKIP